MKFTLSALLTVVISSSFALAHYNFESLVVNGKETAAYQYVRRAKNANSPVTDVKSSDIICNNGGTDADVMAATETYKIAAGGTRPFFWPVESLCGLTYAL